jgi:F-type H+-transporting ATPase subunit b
VLFIAAFAASGAWAAGGSLNIFPDYKSWDGQLYQLIVLFALLVVPVNMLILKPLLRVLDERLEHIEGVRARAERLEKDADAVLEQYEQAVRDVRQEAELARRSQIGRARDQTLEKTGAARSEAEGEIDRARGALASSIESARTALHAEARHLARDVATRVLGRAL